MKDSPVTKGPKSKYTERRKYNGLYNQRAWKSIRGAFLVRFPLCQRCLGEGRLTTAEVVHHVKAHKGNLELFYDTNNLASSCKRCHDAVEQSIERRGYDRGVGEDGWPVSSDHPINQEVKR
jgi:5-methylcytosine-specific restriction endonuclease McrA